MDILFKYFVLIEDAPILQVLLQYVNEKAWSKIMSKKRILILG